MCNARKSFWKKDCPSHGPHQGVFHRGSTSAECPFVGRSRLKSTSDFVMGVREMECLWSEQRHTPHDWDPYVTYSFADSASPSKCQDISYCLLCIAERRWNSSAFLKSSDTLVRHVIWKIYGLEWPSSAWLPSAICPWFDLYSNEKRHKKLPPSQDSSGQSATTAAWLLSQGCSQHLFVPYSRKSTHFLIFFF